MTTPKLNSVLKADRTDKVVALDPALAAARLDQALERFLLDYSDIPRAEATAMWKAAGG